MKKIFLIFLMFFGVILYVFLQTEMLRAESVPSKDDCWWKVCYCSDGVSTYEGCLTSGDGAECTCGNVTRYCPNDD